MDLKKIAYENKTVLMLLLVLVVLYAISSNTEGFSAKKKYHKKHSKKHHKTHHKKHSKKTEHAKQHPKSKLTANLDEGTDSRNYHLVNNREIILASGQSASNVFFPYFYMTPTPTRAGVSGTTDVVLPNYKTITGWTKDTNNKTKWNQVIEDDGEIMLPKPAAGVVYGPFSYGSTDSFPVPEGTEVKYRLYAIYSDTMTTSGNIEVTFKFGWSDDKGEFTVELPLTWGAIDAQRDAYSKFFTTEDIKNAGGDPTQHANIYINTTAPNTYGALWKLYIQTYFVYKN